ncbi:MAG TPA: hypothetical protein ENJ06_01495 [Phycisphaeraceae bacterium]|nr:hypothetical protein [Phycisphaeraceae bacterium]
MLKRLQTFILVTVITVFIWLIAEAQSLDTETHSLQIHLQVSDPQSLIITSDTKTATTVQVEFQGSTATLDRLLHNLSGSVNLLLDTPGEETIDIKNHLSRIAPFKGSGVNIRKVEPAFIENVTVERLIHIKDVPVHAPELSLVTLASAPEVIPDKIEVSIPESMAEEMRSSRYAIAVLDPVQTERIRQLQPGVHELSTRVELPDKKLNKFAKLVPSSVKLKINIHDNTETWTPDPLPVQVQMPPNMTGEFRIVFPEEDKFIKVTFTGPAQGIEKLQADRAAAAPFIALTSDDLVQQVSSAELRFRNLPEGVIATPDKTTVSVKIIKIQPPEQPAGQ